MIPQLDAAVEVQDFCRGLRWPFCFIGALAVIRWGEPRATQDVDATVLTGFGGEETYISGLLRKFESRLPDAVEFALINRVLLLRASNGVDVDIALGGLPYEEEIIRRATEHEFTSNARLLTCSAEDVTILKAFASRPKDWLDIHGVLVRHGAALDWDYVQRNLGPLCELKEAPETLQRLNELRAHVERERPTS